MLLSLSDLTSRKVHVWATSGRLSAVVEDPSPTWSGEHMARLVGNELARPIRSQSATTAIGPRLRVVSHHSEFLKWLAVQRVGTATQWSLSHSHSSV